MSEIFSVIIPTYREWRRVRLCLHALEKQTILETDFEVIIVNNDPDDPVPKDLHLPANVLVIDEPIAGSYVARNAGINIAKGEIFAFLDGDCIPDKDWLRNAISCFSDPSIGLVGGKVEIHKEMGGSDLIYRYEKFTAFRQDKSIPKGYALGGNLFVRRSIVTRVGSFNSEMKSGGDREFSKRCVDYGYKLIYCDSAKVSHPARHSLKDVLVKQKRLTAWEIINASRIERRNKVKFVINQFKNGLVKLFSPRHPDAGSYDKFVFFFVDMVKIFYRLYIGVLVLLKIINPVHIRK